MRRKDRSVRTDQKGRLERQHLRMLRRLRNRITARTRIRGNPAVKRRNLRLPKRNGRVTNYETKEDASTASKRDTCRLTVLNRGENHPQMRSRWKRNQRRQRRNPIPSKYENHEYRGDFRVRK